MFHGLQSPDFYAKLALTETLQARKECCEMAKQSPSMEDWLREAKADPAAAGCGMYLVHNGVVRRSARARVRQGDGSAGEVTGMEFGYEEEKVRRAVEAARAMEGIGYVRVWLNEGVLQVGDDIMFVLIGGDIRPHVVDALQTLVGTLKNECVTERELF